MSDSSISVKKPWSWLPCAFLLLLAIWCVATFRQHGISNDEYVQHTYGQLLLKWYQSGLVDTAAFHFRNLYLYGGMFDLIAALLETLSDIWVWDMRHLLCAAFGWLGFLGVYRLAHLIGGARMGVLSMGLLFLTVSWSGTMFTHTKDIPFATCMLWASYAMVFYVRDLDKTAAKYQYLLGLAVGGALGMRIGGAFAVIELLIVLVLSLLLGARQQHGKILPVMKGLFVRLLPAALVAFVMMAIFWPWGVRSLHNMLEAVHSFSHFAFGMETIANGHVYKIGDVPRSYLVQYLAVKLPEVVLMGLAAIPLLWVLCRPSVESGTTQAAWRVLLVSLLFPLAFVFYDKPALYNGVRHFTFLLPFVVILSAWGLIEIWQRAGCANNTAVRQFQPLWMGVAIGLSLLALQDMLALHPYEYIRVNRFAGTPQQSQYRWENDYWVSAMREVMPSLLQLNLPQRDHHPYLVAVCAETQQGQAYLDHRFQVTKNWIAADFFVSGTNMHCHDVLKGAVIGRVYRQGMLLAVVKDRRQLEGQERRPSPAKN